ncbi:MAG TPA: ATP-binding protein [Candidatus Competibacter sp.]|nr:ATP-binding protein [Candidatus Competibacter sp.]
MIDNLHRSSAANQASLSSRNVVPARVKKVRYDHCDLDLLASEDGPVLGQGRLYQAESLAWKDPKLLAGIPNYQPGKILNAVFVRHLRHEEGQALWFVHERWGLNDPWKELPLAEDDIVTGVVVRRIASAGRYESAGYLIQLDAGIPIQLSSSAGAESSERRQPDIEVFLPSEELPWADGSLSSLRPSSKAGRMALEIGDPIQAMVLEIRFPPMDPRVSLTRLINHRDATADRDFNHRDTLARWRFRHLLSGDKQGTATTDETPPAFSPDDRPYVGRRLLLVDDNADAMASQAELLELMGAEIERILVKPNSLEQAVGEVVSALRGGRFDLALIDSNLPGRDLGQALIEQVRSQLGADHPIRLVLLTANPTKTIAVATLDALRARGVAGMVQRPMSHCALRNLLAGEEVWELAVSTEQHQPATEAHLTLQHMLETIAHQEGVSFAVLVKARRRIETQDLITTGDAPFKLDEYPKVLTRTDLRLLVDDRLSQLTITAKEGGNALLRAGGTGPAHWQVLELGGNRWIFGVGHAPGRDVQDQLPFWCMALTAMLEAQGWRDWARHVSGFVQLGLAHQGLSHEVFNLEGEIGNLLDSLRRWLGKQGPNVKLEGNVRNYIDGKVAALIKTSGDLLDFSKRQLRGQALRRQRVFLPDAVAAIKRIVASECLESEVTLHVANPPPLALPLPNAALVLPAVNLLVNAAKHHYRSENRRVELLFDLEEVGTRQFLVMDVRDNGPGLEKDALEHLWQPGFSSATEVDKRHGIGLWLSRQLIKESGGKLDLHKNWRGLGACFRIRFPINLG